MLCIRDATLSFGDRTVWSDLNIEVEPGEFVAVLGANGSGKTSLLRVILGQQKLTSGSVAFDSAPVTRGNRRIGYVPQQRLVDEGTPVRARDLVGFGLDGHRWGCLFRRGVAAAGSTRCSPTWAPPIMERHQCRRSRAVNNSAFELARRSWRARRCCCATNRSLSRSRPTEGGN